MSYLFNFLIKASMRNFVNYLYFEVWVECEGGLVMGEVPMMHKKFGLRWARHLHLSR